VLEIRFTRRLLTGWSEGNMALGTGSIQHGIEHLVGRGDESNLQLSPEGLLGALHSCSFEDSVDELDGVDTNTTKDFKYEWSKAQSLPFASLQVQGLLALFSDHSGG